MQQITLDVEENLRKGITYTIAFKADDAQGHDIPDLEDEVIQIFQTICAELELPLTVDIFVTVMAAISDPELEAYIKENMYPARRRQELLSSGYHTHYNVQVPKDFFYQFVYKAIEITREEMNTKYTQVWWENQQKRVKDFHIERDEKRISSYEERIYTATMTIDDRCYTLYVHKCCDDWIVPNPGSELIDGRYIDADGRHYWFYKNSSHVLMSDNEAIAYQAVNKYINDVIWDEELGTD